MPQRLRVQSVERLDTQMDEMSILLQSVRRQCQDKAKTTRIAKSQHLTGCQLEADVLVGLQGKARRAHGQTTAHPQVNDKRGVFLDVDEEVLGSTAKSADSAPDQPAPKASSVYGFTKGPIVDRDGLDPLAGKQGLEAEP